MTRTRVLLSLGTGLLTLAACTGDPDPSGPGGGPATEFRLVSFDSCEEAEQELREATSRYASQIAFGYGMGRSGAEDSVAGGSAMAPEAAGARGMAQDPGLSDQDGQDHSTTNVHEAGVDEPDIIKTDGERIVMVTGAKLRVVDAARGTQIGRLDLRPEDDGQANPDIAYLGWEPSDLLLFGDRALVLFDSGWWHGMPMPDIAVEGVAGPAGSPLPAEYGSRLLLIDLSDAPRIVSEYRIEGSLLDARAVGPTVRVVVRSAPRLPMPEVDPQASEREIINAMRDAIEEATIENWLPRYQLTTNGETEAGQVPCTSLSRPQEYSGASMLTVLTFDVLAPELGDGLPVSVAADGDTVYSNGASLYIASDQRWRVMPNAFAPDQVDERTEIYKFDTSQPGQPTYVGAGSVPGWLINQYALSEWDGHLRVATTSGSVWSIEEDEAIPSESAVYVLAEQDGELVEVGSVGGLGEGERIYSVRFTGPTGYVVTFRETDPLYTLDLSDPAEPAVIGELKIPGYSSYLHPLGDGRLIGIGQEADENGVVQGTQVSLFDVTNLADPTRLAQYHIEYGSSEAEYDPHAFLWWPDDRILVIPLTVYDWGGSGGQLPDWGALVLRVEDTGFTELGTVRHPVQVAEEYYNGMIQRSLVIGDTLWTLSATGLQANSLSTLQQASWIPFE
ncbi:MAG TPA: beta-propeller domain-containing protein [Natronosporangium sp.]